MDQVLLEEEVGSAAGTVTHTVKNGHVEQVGIQPQKVEGRDDHDKTKSNDNSNQW
eukprot:CAMPEP_0175160048 /NCGR_PEP_ID=MMETSP0087-20121206/23781_1 /TAXON_ID=136419 /ORGANISM="Unknown Unknown, Strain D1" /LENGTH=54 /DNA_ID=CAMNT_0016448205 /DNA_START=156 /DNA_END=317 /DNA_ORIENTATION=+